MIGWGQIGGWILWAQDGGGAAPGGFLPLPLMLMIFVLLFWFVIQRPQQRQKKEHLARMEALKKNDRVVTIGGIYGIVNNIRRESDDIELKTDESSGSVIHVTFAAISRVIDKDKEKDKEKA